ncbi:FadR/GntR family transcriptional regulator [Nonomuraea sp. NPDC000554]|uniref:FadR/GntR family transcriptional regulator n=1 Tax=Nonomuraea sp. NPDC000554 TaxID=3154259 RepID=UPI003330CEEB
MAERLSKSVADDLLARIAGGEFRPGDTLPSELALTVAYGVGRNTVREAMQSLRALGLVEIRPRLGARVLASRAENALASSAISALLRDQTVHELYEVRLILEPAAAAKAAVNRTDEDLRAIKQALGRFRVAYELGAPSWKEDIEFHQAVAEASGNSVLSRLLAPMADLLSNARQATSAIPAAAERALHEHEAIAVAIEARSGRQARTAMATHVRSAIWALGLLEEADSAPTATATS